MSFKEHDFVEISYDMYANGKLVSTTYKKKAEENKVPLEKKEILILGRGDFLKALHNDIIKNYKDGIKRLVLKPEEAFGKKKRELLITYSKNIFTRDKLNPVVGGVYSFDGRIGIVKSVTGGRVLIDFNNPLAGKEIALDYIVERKIDKIDEKISVILKKLLNFEKEKYKFDEEKKELIFNIKVTDEKEKELIIKLITDEITNLIPDLKGLKIKFDIKKDLNKDAKKNTEKTKD